MNDELLESIRRYTCKHKQALSRICEPLNAHLGISYFTYYFIEADGHFGTLSNQPDFLEYYYYSHKHIANPYMSHPDAFRNGYTLTPCAYDPDNHQDLIQKHAGDHLFMNLNKTPGKVEGFLFARANLKSDAYPEFVNNLDLLNKFARYFKREAAPFLGKLYAEDFNIKNDRGDAFFETTPSLALSSADHVEENFFKDIYGLSPQEIRCVHLFQKGHSAQATAAMMKLSRRTVEGYFESVKNKLGCSSKWELLDI